MIEGEEEVGEEHSEVHLASWRWEELGPFVTIFGFAVFSGVAKIGFHHAHFLSSRVPESCLLVLVGLGFGVLIDYGGLTTFPEYTTEFFFHYLLPPIILDAAYSLYNQAFLDNIRTILLFAVVGTAFNFLLIGGLLWGVNELGMMGHMGPLNITRNNTELYYQHYPIQPYEIFTFSSLISAVDPVAVLAIFQEVGVNSELYFIVFGESLLNDGVAVVFYSMMNTFSEIIAAGYEVTWQDCLMGCASFITIAFGGLAVGILFALLTALITRTTREVDAVEPLIVLGLALLAYYTSELFHWSGIISLIGCGIVQAHYSFKNISESSRITIDYFSRMLGSTMESVIFLYLGKALLGKDKSWHWDIFAGFTAWTLVLCLIVRFLGVYLFTFFVNRKRITPISLKEQFIMAYGGLRGAVGFSLVLSIDKSVIPSSDMLVSTTLIVVMCTIWIQGSTIKPLVNLLDIDKAEEEAKKMLTELNDLMTEKLMSGVMLISGRTGFAYYLQLFIDFDKKYFYRVFVRNSGNDNSMTKLFEQLAINDHKENLYTNKKMNGVNHLDNGKTNPGFQDNHTTAVHMPASSNLFNHIETTPSNLLMPDMRLRRSSTVSAYSGVSRLSRTPSMMYSRPVVDSGMDDKKALRTAIRFAKYGGDFKTQERRQRSISDNLSDNDPIMRQLSL